jgi:heterodisulfide reductase subunit B
MKEDRAKSEEQRAEGEKRGSEEARKRERQNPLPRSSAPTLRYALFAGCTVPARARHYELSVRRVADIFGIELIDLPDFTCCGFPLGSVDTRTSILMAARNLSIAEEAESRVAECEERKKIHRGSPLHIATMCNACTSILSEVNWLMQNDARVRDYIKADLAQLGRKYDGTVQVKHFARILHEDIGIDRLRASVNRELSDLEFASHYGCHYLKPSEFYGGFDTSEDPQSLDILVSAAGASPADYENKRQCCGGGLLAIDEQISLQMSRDKLEHVKESGADAINLVCPFCSVMYDDSQRRIERTFGVEYNIPVLYYPQILGLAVGLEPEELGLKMNRVNTAGLLAKILDLGSPSPRKDPGVER